MVGFPSEGHEKTRKPRPSVSMPPPGPATSGLPHTGPLGIASCVQQPWRSGIGCPAEDLHVVAAVPPVSVVASRILIDCGPVAYQSGRPESFPA